MFFVTILIKNTACRITPIYRLGAGGGGAGSCGAGSGGAGGGGAGGGGAGGGGAGGIEKERIPARVYALFLVS